MINLDREITNEKLESLDLAFETDKAFIHNGKGIQAFVVTDTGERISYMSLYNTGGTDWAGFLIPCKGLKNYKFSAARLIKDVFDDVLREIIWTSVHTISKSDRIIDRWMYFLGFRRYEKVIITDREEDFYLWRKNNGR